MAGFEMSRDDLTERLEELGRRLDGKGLTGRILLTGGAAMCLVHESRAMTQDIDALFEPKDEIVAIASEMALEHGWPENWFNDSVSGFIGSDPPRDFFKRLPGLEVFAVSPEYLLAMKLAASRLVENSGRDMDDIHFLGRKLGYTAPGRFYETYERYFKKENLPRDAHFIISEFFNPDPSEG